MVYSTQKDLTPSEAAKKLGKSYRFVIAIIKAGELEARDEKSPKSKLPRYRIPPHALTQWQLGRTVRPLSERERRVRSLPRMAGVLSARRASKQARQQNVSAQHQTA
jgi:hypothetical protein